MNEEILRLIRALIGELIVIIDNDDIKMSAAVFIMETIEKLDKAVEQETGEHFTPVQYVSASKDELIQQALADPDLPEDEKQKIILMEKASSQLLGLFKDLMAGADAPKENVEIDEDSPFNDFIQGMSFDDKVN